MMAEWGHPPWARGKPGDRLGERVWPPPNVQFMINQFVTIQYLMNFLDEINDRYNTNKY